MITLDWATLINRQGPDLPVGTAMTIGVFDGVHRGHQGLLGRLLRQSPLIPTVVTFRQNPKEALGKHWGGELLSLSRRLSLFESFGAALTVLIDFSGNFSKLKGRDFFNLLRGPGNLKFLTVGDNFRCGRGLDTGVAELGAMSAEAGIPTEVAEPVMEGGHPVSSSRIRTAIRGGHLSMAAALLGRKVEIDVSGLPVKALEGGIFYDAASRRRVIPPEGRYPALFCGEAFPQGAETVISVEKGGVFVPFPEDPSGFFSFKNPRIELIT